MSDQQSRSKVVPLPRRIDDVCVLFRRMLDLPNVQRIEVTPSAMVVERICGENDEVLPPATVALAELDADFLLSRLQLTTYKYEEGEHGLLRFNGACHALSLRGSHVVGVIAPNPLVFGAFLGLPEGVRPTTAFGMPVFYPQEGSPLVDSDKFVVVGSLTTSVRDAAFGVAADLGD